MDATTLKALMRETHTDGYPEDLLALAHAIEAAERERCAALCRRVADESRNSAQARETGRRLANWISTGNPEGEE